LSPASLDIRLPLGLRDYLPGPAAHRRTVGQALIGTFERWGYAGVLLPPFEYQDVLAPGLGERARAAAFLFVEPMTGKVVSLPPDVTPQVARLAATHLAEVDGPLRLSYQARLVRQDGARGQKELFQAGVELFGVQGDDGDAEVMALCAEAIAAAGLSDLTLDVAHPYFLRSALERLAPAVRQRMQALIARKDTDGVRRLAHDSGAPHGHWCVALCELYGDPEVVLPRLEAMAEGAPEAVAVQHLAGTVRRLAQRTTARVTIDLGDVRGHDYYTGTCFSAYVPGAPDAIAAGGRYDDLVARYGRALPGTGFAIDVDAVADLCAARGLHAPGGTLGVLVCGDAGPALHHARELRTAGLRVPEPDRGSAAALDLARLVAYARSVGLAGVLEVRGERLTLHTTQATSEAPAGARLAAWITTTLGRT
jgi:ATP phosphoribosyltransferase regulatory subunit